MKFINRFLLASLLLCTACNCSGGSNGIDEPEKKPGEENPPVEVAADAVSYTTTADGRQKMQEKQISFGKTATMSPYAVRLQPGTTYQTVSGFGAAITGATGYNLLKMSAEDRMAFLKEVFDMKEGLGSSLVRVAIGSSDFGTDEYTWCDTQGMENFGVHPLDAKEVIPILKEIYKINPEVKIIGSPWTAPRWMKTNGQWTSGTLKPSCYEDYALYLVKWVQTMEAEGFSIEAITIQNEPLNHGNSMSMYMGWEQQRDFIKLALGPAFQKAGLKTKLLVFDHNFNYDNQSDQKNYPLNIMDDPEASRYVAGSAWHNYGGNVSELDNIVARQPKKEIYFTEASIGTWNYKFGDCLIWDFKDLFIGTLKRGAKGVTLWNLMLDDHGAPNRPGGCQTCFGAVEVSSSTYKITDRKSHYYNIAHASKVIKPGAVRIATDGYTVGGVEYLAFKNPDGSYGVIFVNETSEAHQFVFVSEKHSVKVDVTPKSLVSLGWKD